MRTRRLPECLFVEEVALDLHAVHRQQPWGERVVELDVDVPVALSEMPDAPPERLSRILGSNAV